MKVAAQIGEVGLATTMKKKTKMFARNEWTC